MMPEQKGRSGKKPKYQIPDIGGSDLTAEDISTERVLNFLIKGETSPSEQVAPLRGTVTGESDSVPAPAPRPVQNKVTDASLPSSKPTPQKGLAHLFERANSGGRLTKELPLRPPTGDPVPPPSLEAPPVNVPLVDDKGRARPPAAPVINQSAGEIEPAASASESVALESPELAHYIELWKNFYRLKTGEVDALRAMYRLSHGQGRDVCHVKMHNLAEISNLTYRYCQKVVRSLEQLGWITKLKDYDPTDQLGVLYRVNLKPSLPLY